MKRFSAAAIVLAFLLTPAALEANNSFYRILAAKPNATFEDAVQAFFNLAVGTQQQQAGTASFDDQARALIDMKIIRKKWTRKPKARLTRGRVAHMICRTCGIRGGLTMTIFGASERYAYRECVYKGVWSGGNQRARVTGGELLGLLKWAADYIEEHPGKKVKPRGSAGATQKTKPQPKVKTTREASSAEYIANELDAAEKAKK